jgi:adenylosuccinate synthase
MRHHAVIGAAFGDEGKGRTVDYLLSQAQHETLVVRHNSGAQAGHTVEYGGKRHVNQHVGSGTLRGVPTLLGPEFVVNPILFNREYDKLAALGITPTVYVSHQCRISTPVDMIINVLQEQQRGADRHGSCGVGFGETVQRYEQGPASPLNFGDLDDYYLIQVAKRDLTPTEDCPYHVIHQMILEGDFDWQVFHEEYTLFRKRTIRVDDAQIRELIKGKQLIFEGAQGLGLHQDHENFPHVTRCRTGSEDVLTFLDWYAKPGEPLTVNYCMRAYLTRHGAGPMPGEDPSLSYPDETNRPNQWQGALRFGPFDEEMIGAEIVRDLRRAGQRLRTRSRFIEDRLVMNCADQVAVLPALASRVDLLGWGADSSQTETRHRALTPA